MSPPPAEETPARRSAATPSADRIRGRGRITRAQKRALREYWPRYGLEYTPTPLDQELAFGRCAPLWLDIGAGNGDSSLHLARAHPHCNILVIEPYAPGAGQLLHRLAKDPLNNVRLLRYTARPILEQQLPKGCLERVFILFPDPWPKQRHHKRRLLNRSFLRLLAQGLATQGRIHIATDCTDYAQAIRLALRTAPQLANLAGADRYAPRARHRPQTRYEATAQAAGRPIHEFLLAHAPGEC